MHDEARGPGRIHCAAFARDRDGRQTACISHFTVDVSTSCRFEAQLDRRLWGVMETASPTASGARMLTGTARGTFFVLDGWPTGSRGRSRAPATIASHSGTTVA